MSENLFHTIQEVQEIRDDPQAVNELLSAGWILLNTYSTNIFPDSSYPLESVYVLGRPFLDLKQMPARE